MCLQLLFQVYQIRHSISSGAACCLLAVWLGIRYLTPISLSFSVCEMGVTTYLEGLVRGLVK